jgi:hypothetical protein
MRRLTTLAMVLGLLGGVAGCGSGGRSAASSGPPYHYSAQQRTAVQSECVSAVREVGKEGLVGIAEHAAEECQCYLPLREAKAPATKTIAAGDVLSDPACVFNERTKATTQKHTPEEEEHRRNNLEAEEKVAHEEKALQNTPGASKACEEEKRTQEKLRYEHPGSPPEPQREAEYEKLCNR